jgi:hypothetical protein
MCKDKITVGGNMTIGKDLIRNELPKHYATVWAKDKDTGFITEDQCKNDDDVAAYVCDSDYEIIKIEYHEGTAQ